ncbi:MAG TPA: UDP-N-acetylmuramoyl-L-alanyl-D-glutamate--2,6-diaminopimelate ligase [Gemmatimonadales bacterium]
MTEDPRDSRLAGVLEALSRAGLLTAPVPECPAVTSLTDDSRQVRPGAFFLALPGTQTDGHRYVTDAVRSGAVLVLAERPVDAGVPVVLVRDAREGARVAAGAWYRDVASRTVLLGVTGTNGKTTTVAVLRHLLNTRGGGDTGSIGTLGAFDAAGEAVPSSAGSLTTPGPVDLHATFAALAARGVTRIAMEASSHSLHQGRLDGLVFAGAVFTNFTREHLDYHGTMGEYLAAKLLLADLLAPAPGAVLAFNRDDSAWESIAFRHPVSFGLGRDADVRAEQIAGTAEGSRFRLTGRYGIRDVSLPLPGDFNVMNALAASALALGLGVELDTVVERLGSAPQVPGRMERLAIEPCLILRDYAHTPDALERVLRTLRPLTSGRLMVLFGCGGDRDRGKRPLMGRIAAELADLAIVTSDNPRTEDPERILDDIVAGMSGGGTAPIRMADRRAAIAHAIEVAREGDTLLLAGKGHETYQVIGSVKHPFDEGVIVRGLVEGGGGD